MKRITYQVTIIPRCNELLNHERPLSRILNQSTNLKYLVKNISWTSKIYTPTIKRLRVIVLPNLEELTRHWQETKVLLTASYKHKIFIVWVLDIFFLNICMETKIIPKCLSNVVVKILRVFRLHSYLCSLLFSSYIHWMLLMPGCVPLRYCDAN